MRGSCTVAHLLFGSGSRRSLFDSIFMMQSSEDGLFLDQVIPRQLMSPIRGLRSLGKLRSPPSSSSCSGPEGVSVAWPQCEGVATYKVGTFYEQTQSPSYSSWKRRPGYSA